MNAEQLQLMHEVLDGEASADDARALDRLLATDPEARAEYEELRRLFEGLNAVPMAVPPEGLLAETLAKVAPQHKRRHRLRQLSSGWRVFISDSRRPRDRPRVAAARTQHSIQGEHNRGNAVMSEFSGKQRLLIGAGVAVAAVVVGAWYFDVPPSQDMSGTIAPANRSVAAQPGAADMTVASQGNVQPVPVSVTDDASRDAARDASRDASRDAARDASRDASRDAAKDAARDASRDAAKDAAKDASRDASRDAAKDAARDASRDAAKDASRDASRDAAKDAARDASRDAAKDASRDASGDAARDASRDASRDAARDASPQ
jgi:anti-sigma factor RsiW